MALKSASALPIRPLGLKHALEHFLGQKVHVLGEHAEDHPINKLRDIISRVTLFAEVLRCRNKRLGNLFGCRIRRAFRT